MHVRETHQADRLVRAQPNLNNAVDQIQQQDAVGELQRQLNQYLGILQLH